MSVDPSLAPLLGRYEYTDGDRSDKFWAISFESRTGRYNAEWGKNGRPAQGTCSYSGVEALKKIQEKISKGYKLVEKYKMEKIKEAFDPFDKIAKRKRKEPAKDEIDEEIEEISGKDFMSALRKL